MVNTLAWSKKKDSWPTLLVCAPQVMLNRDSWEHSYLIVRGEFLGIVKDDLLRKHLPRMFPLIKNKCLGIEDDEIPS